MTAPTAPGSAADGGRAPADGGSGTPGRAGSAASQRRRTRSQIALVARRELRERGRSKVFRGGTIVVLLVIAAAVVVPVLLRSHRGRIEVGVVGTLPHSDRALVMAASRAAGTPVVLVTERSEATAAKGLRDGRLSLAVLDGHELLLFRALPAGDASATAIVTAELSLGLGLQRELESAGLSANRAARLANPPPLPVHSLEPAQRNQTTRYTAIYGLILVYVLLSQYCSWILLGVVEEKSSRVIEVILSTIRPVQLLAGKVVGLGLLALAQAAIFVAAALGIAEAVGSDLVRGTAPTEVAAVLVWLLLGYAFYCWVYAAAGSLCQRQEDIQTLAFPLTVPMLVAYIVALTEVSSPSPSILLEVLAYLPPTAPLAMPVLVAQGAVSWLGFLLSCGLTVLAIALAVRGATFVYSRAVLRTGRRVRLRDVLTAS